MRRRILYPLPMIRDRRNETRKRIFAHADPAGKRILEIGCGEGRVTRTYADEARFAVGLEPDYPPVQKATSAVPEATFICGSGMDIPFAPSCFDVVLYTLSLHHHPNCLDALAQARRVIKRDGLILVIEPTVESEIQRLCKVFEDEDHRLMAVENSLPRTPLEIISRETFSTHWEFADFDDAAHYAFTYYDHPPDVKKRTALKAFLGPKVNEAPLIMTDTLRLTSLRPPR